MGYGARVTSIGEFFWLSESRIGESGARAPSLARSIWAWGILEPEGGVPDWAPSFALAPFEIMGIAITSFSFFLYFSLSWSALSKSLFNPKIIARCLSTRRQSWVFCCDCDCFSLRRYWIRASGLPAVLIRWEMSGRLFWVSWRPFAVCDLAEMAEMAESIEELRGGTLEELA